VKLYGSFTGPCDGLAMTAHAPAISTSAKDRYAKLAFAIGVFLVVLEAAYLLASHLPYDPEGFLVGRDFVNTWMGARIALTGDPTPWFDFDTYNAALRSTWGAAYPQHIWSYPPHLLLFTWPFGLMPYLPGLAVWSAIGFALYLIAAADGDRRPQTLILLAVAPAVVMNIFTGQNGFFTTALLVGGLTILDRRPLLAGILFGLLTIKPQLGLLVPVMLVLTGRWRTIAAAAATTAALAGLTTLVFGPRVWTAYLDVAMPAQTHAITHGTGIFVSMMPTPFMNLRATGLPLDLAWSVQAVVSGAALAAIVWTFWKRRDPGLSMALLVTAAFLVTPYAFNYDMVIFGWVLAKVADRSDNAPFDYGLMLAVWTLPVTTIAAGLAGIPGSALVLIAFAGRLLGRLAHAGEVPAGSADGAGRQAARPNMAALAPIADGRRMPS